jgi:hypothetical protein
MLDRNDTVSIKDVQDNIIKPGIENNLTYMKSNFVKLISSIEKLQQQYVSLSDLIKIVQDIQKSFEILCDPNEKAVKKKFYQVLEKSRGFSALIKISKFLTGEETSCDLCRRRAGFLSLQNFTFK